jgi:zinc protease
MLAPDFRIPFEKYKLPNGLRVILSQDHSVPVVTLYLIYGVGARSEQEGRTGFAHLFEHMMFQGSRNAPKGAHFRMVESNGGAMNGSTHPDYTDYFEVLPSNKLAVGLWLEADRMRGLSISEENLANQKEAVKQERRLSFDNQPYATAIVDRWPELAFRNWHNSHSLIGSFEDLDAATLTDVAAFFKTHYAPNNAVLVLAGDLRIPDAKRLTETYFADIEPQPQPPLPDLSEPPQTAPRSQVCHDPLAKVPALVVAYPGPERRSPDYYALGVLDTLLTGGESSRFHQNLVKGRKSVVQFEANLGWPFASPADYKHPANYGIFLLYNPQFTGPQILGQLEEEIASLQQHPVAPAELERARTFLRSTRIRRLQTSAARAALLAQYELLDANPDYINTELSFLLAVTPGQIQAAAAAYLLPHRQTVLDIQPEAQ